MASAAARLDRQAAEHGAAYDARQAEISAAREQAEVSAAREQVEAVRAAVVGALVDAATVDAEGLIDAGDRAREADAALRAAGRFRRRGAERAQQDASRLAAE